MSNSRINHTRDGRRQFLKTAAVAGGTTLLVATGVKSLPTDTLATLLQDHFLRMEPEEVVAALARIERKTKQEYGVDIHCENTPAMPGVRFGFALNLSKCKGTRHCVKACVLENNCDRGETLQNIRVLEMEKGSRNLDQSNHYYEGLVPALGKWYLPVQCHQCENPPCVQACPVGATWQEPDGIIVIDYSWCIGCRYCAVSCPYWARHFNWGKPVIPTEEMNPHTHYLGNRPRPKGAMEKCTFCIQRTRQNQLPACLEACPTGARTFGNLTDPNSEIRYLLTNRSVFRLKENQNTDPKFWYFVDAPK